MPMSMGAINGCLRLLLLPILLKKIVGMESPAGIVARCGAEAEKAIGHCLEPMLAYANAIQMADGADGHRHFSLKGPQVFQRLCTLYTDFKECTSAFQCRSLSVQAVEASYGFMCGSGQNEFQEHADCFARVENRPEYIKCRSDAAEAMDRVAARQKEEEEQEDDQEGHRGQLCLAMADYLGCCRPLVEKNCGQKAWALVARITRDSLRVSLPKCQLAVLLDDKGGDGGGGG